MQAQNSLWPRPFKFCRGSNQGLLEQMVRNYGHYSNAARGKGKKQDQDGLLPSDSETIEDPDFSGEESSEEFRRSCARLM
jgi:hypothetical protein